MIAQQNELKLTIEYMFAYKYRVFCCYQGACWLAVAQEMLILAIVTTNQSTGSW